MLLNVEALTKAYRGRGGQSVVAVDGIGFSVEEGKMFTLLGPSGCGKTTTLRSIAGLERPDSGHIEVADRVLFSSRTGSWVPPNERGLGMVFQSYAIWPHMDVFGNVAFPLQVARKRHGKREIRERVERVLDVVKLGHLADRPATDLSGGQQQRLALARALVLEPPLLLLDEPLSNLDAKLREAMRFELKRLQRDLGVTAVYVTHDQGEALAMSNEIAVMSDGRIMQLGRPRDVYEHPVNRFVADFIGTSNFFEGQAEPVGGGRYRVDTPLGTLDAATDETLTRGQAVTVAVRPEHISIERADGVVSPGVGRWVGSVRTRAFTGEAVDHIVQVGDQELRVRSDPRISIAENEQVVLGFSAEQAAILPRE